MIDPGTLSGSEGTAFAYDINNAGQVVGSSGVPNQGEHPFLYSNGEMTDLGLMRPGFAFNRAVAINDLGQVTGTSGSNPFFEYAFLYTDGQMIDLGNLGGNIDAGQPVALGSHAYVINDAGQVVGGSINAAGSNRAFLYTNRQMYDLNDLIDLALCLTLPQASAINDSGQIVANSVSRA